MMSNNNAVMDTGEEEFYEASYKYIFKKKGQRN